MNTKGYEAFESFGPGRNSGPWFGGQFRAGRGMMEPAILSALSEKPMHGYEIISYFEETSHGMWRPSPGSVYPTLQLLEEKGYIEAIPEDGKKVYHVTSEGKQASKEAHEEREQWRGEFAHRFHHAKDFRKDFRDIIIAIRTINHKGNAVQTNQLQQALRAFKLRLQEIAAEES